MVIIREIEIFLTKVARYYFEQKMSYESTMLSNLLNSDEI